MKDAHREHVERAYLRRLGADAGLIITLGVYLTSFVGFVTFSVFLWQFAKQHSAAIFSSESLIWKISIIVYFSSWISGVRADKSREEAIYLSAPNRGRIDPVSAVSALLVFVLFALMLLAEEASPGSADTPAGWLQSSVWARQMTGWYAADGPAAFVVFLNVLWFFNIFIWRLFIRKFIAPMARRSAELYAARGDHLGTLKIGIFGDYIMGEWQWRRFAAGAAYLLLMNVLFLRGAGGAGGTQLYLSLLVAGFVGSMEFWIWLRRYKTKFSLACVEEIGERYDLVPNISRAADNAATETAPDM